MRVKITSLQDAPINSLEALLQCIPSTLLYTSVNYLRLLSSYLSCEIDLILAYSEYDEIVGYFPLAYKTGSLGTVANSLPFYGSNGSMVVSPKVESSSLVRSALLNTALDRIEEKKCVAATFITNPLDCETDKWIRDNLSYQLRDERIGQITHLPNDSEDLSSLLIKSFDDPRPRNIKKALREGVSVSVAHDDDTLLFLSDIHTDNIKAINGIPKERKFFLEISNHFDETQYRVYIARYQGKRIGALLLFYYNQTVEYFTPAVIENFRYLQPTALLVFQAMIDAIRGGYRNWNWGGTWLTQGGVYDFKKKWGTTDYPYYYYTVLKEDKALNQSKEVILRDYPFFFVVPFSMLNSEITSK